MYGQKFSKWSLVLQSSVTLFWKEMDDQPGKPLHSHFEMQDEVKP